MVVTNTGRRRRAVSTVCAKALKVKLNDLGRADTLGIPHNLDLRENHIDPTLIKRYYYEYELALYYGGDTLIVMVYALGTN